nr:undecaprenyldiphospho-muramoylpentapeptide beta-N-acetylglucosaminyltransferase [Ardenticatena sp.]
MMGKIADAPISTMSVQAETALRLVMTGGGTGGHVYPALSMLDAAQERPTILWIGSEGGLEAELVQRAGIPFAGIAAGGVRGMSPARLARNILRLMRGFWQAWRLLREFRPDVVLATGGYVTFPVGVAAWLQRIPLLIYLPDIEPGLAVKALAPFATCVAVTGEAAQGHFRAGKTVVTGYPVRRALRDVPSREAARTVFGIPADARVVLVMGGSQGAHSLNQAVGHNIKALLALAHVIHIHGRSDGEWLQSVRDALSEPMRQRYHLFDYLHDEMAAALRAADIVVARAGASTLGELPAAGVAAVLVPYPYSGAHQWANAKHLAAHGGALIVPDAEIQQRLVPVVEALVEDEERLHMMQAAMQKLAQPDAAQRLYDLVRASGRSKQDQRSIMKGGH